MHVDPLIPILTAVLLVVVITALAARILRQPSVVAFIVAGVLIGPHVLAIIEDSAVIEKLSGIGVVFLLLFVGLDLRLRDLVARWRAPVLGTLLQVLLSLLATWIIGAILGWTLARIVLLGFVITISSTAVIVRLTSSGRSVPSPLRRDLLSITVAQDLAIIPMMIVLSLLAGDSISWTTLSLQITGAALFALALIGAFHHESRLALLFSRAPRDSESRVLVALLLAFGIAMISAAFQLSVALGAFAAGLLVSTSRRGQWVRQALDPFRVVFSGVFFLSIGMLVDISFLVENGATVFVLLGVTLLLNTLINAVILRLLGHGWRESVYGGSMHAQIGEFSFVLAAIGLGAGIIGAYSFQMTTTVIALSLLIAPIYTSGLSMLIHRVFQGPSRSTGSAAGPRAEGR